MLFGGFFDEPKRSRPNLSPERDLLYTKQKGNCNGCGKSFDKRNLAVDHIRPFSQGHGDRITNLQLLCTACNSLKGTGTMAQLRKKLQVRGITKSSAKATTSGKKKVPVKRAPAKKRQTRNKDPFADLFG